MIPELADNIVVPGKLQLPPQLAAETTMLLPEKVGVTDGRVSVVPGDVVPPIKVPDSKNVLTSALLNATTHCPG
jgi:hypothetical protein